MLEKQFVVPAEECSWCLARLELVDEYRKDARAADRAASIWCTVALAAMAALFILIVSLGARP